MKQADLLMGALVTSDHELIGGAPYRYLGRHLMMDAVWLLPTRSEGPPFPDPAQLVFGDPDCDAGLTDEESFWASWRPYTGTDPTG